MTKEEFEARTIEVSDSDFEAINQVYVNSGLEIDEFCKQWCDVNKNRGVNYWKLDEDLRKVDAICEMIWKIEAKGYECGNQEIAADLLTKQEIIALEMADIKVVREHPIKCVDLMGKIEYRPDMKSMREVGYEVRKYIRTHI